jgi:SAM-dependent methyltransferase
MFNTFVMSNNTFLASNCVAESNFMVQLRHNDRHKYFNDSAFTSERYYIPFLAKYAQIHTVNKLKVLEVGCGEGGNLVPFAKHGASVTGIDINKQRIAEAKEYFAKYNLTGYFECADITKYTSNERFDLIISHNMIEHLHDKGALLHKIASLLTPTGRLLLVFPPWQMPFGGHQQMAVNKIISHMPYIHILPNAMYSRLMRLAGETEGVITDLLDIKSTRVSSLRKLEKMIRSAGLTVHNKRYYLINPDYDIKFGLRPRFLPPPLCHIVGLRNFICTSCFWVIGGASIRSV